jgi:hypothetical protein
MYFKATAAKYSSPEMPPTLNPIVPPIFQSGNPPRHTRSAGARVGGMGHSPPYHVAKRFADAYIR